MKIKRPIYLDTVNLISIILLPLSFFTFLFNYLKKLSPKVKFKVKTICAVSYTHLTLPTNSGV